MAKSITINPIQISVINIVYIIMQNKLCLFVLLNNYYVLCTSNWTLLHFLFVQSSKIKPGFYIVVVCRVKDLHNELVGTSEIVHNTEVFLL